MDNTALILQALVNGLVIGVVYTLMAVGFTMVFGIMRVVNFAHGEFYMMGGYVALFLYVTLNLPFLIVILLAGIAVAVVGALLSLVTVMPFRNDELNGMIAAIGISVIMQKVALVLFGASPRMLPNMLDGSVQLGPIIVPSQRLLVVGVAIVVLLAFWLFIQRHKTGKAMRAVAQDSEAAVLQGISVRRIYILSFALGVGLAGLVGALMAPVFAVSPYAGAVPMLKAFVVVILGGLGSVPGAIVGGMLLGMIESLGSSFLGAMVSDLVQLGLVILMLILKPSGLLGRGHA